jgi:hypothetical protein
MVFSFFGSFPPHFQIKLSIHGSNLNSTFIIMRELKFFSLIGLLTQNFKTVDLVKFLEQNQKLHILIVAVTLKVTSCRTMSKKNWKKWKTKILWTKQISFLAPCSSALGQFLPHDYMLELLKKYRKNELNTRFQQKFATGSYGVGIGSVWCSQKACEKYSSLV